MKINLNGVHYATKRVVETLVKNEVVRIVSASSASVRARRWHLYDVVRN